jgi:cell fate regulator YaaT (PSP1 superfamily)
MKLQESIANKSNRPHFIVGVRLFGGEQSRLFDPGSIKVRVGNHVMAETEEGTQIGIIASNKILNFSKDPKCKYGRVIRLANDSDMQAYERKLAQEQKAKVFCLQKIDEQNLPMNLSRVVHSLESRKTIFYFTAEGRVDFRLLIKELAGFLRIRIEMRQVGVRDEARSITGVGVCGEELCCSRFLKDFNPVTIRMAKDQGLALNPGKISGVCGRLMCCLQYEHEIYRTLSKEMPKVGKKVNTPLGPGRIIKNEILSQTVIVRHDDESILTHPMGDVTIIPNAGKTQEDSKNQ